MFRKCQQREHLTNYCIQRLKGKKYFSFWEGTMLYTKLWSTRLGGTEMCKCQRYRSNSPLDAKVRCYCDCKRKTCHIFLRQSTLKRWTFFTLSKIKCSSSEQRSTQLPQKKNSVTPRSKLGRICRHLQFTLIHCFCISLGAALFSCTDV